MSREAIESLIERWMDDAEFRKAVRENPEEAIKTSGADLTEEEMEAVRAVDWNLSDEELTTRANKGTAMCTEGAGCGCGGCGGVHV